MHIMLGGLNRKKTIFFVVSCILFLTLAGFLLINRNNVKADANSCLCTSSLTNSINDQVIELLDNNWIGNTNFFDMALRVFFTEIVQPTMDFNVVQNSCFTEEVNGLVKGREVADILSYTCTSGNAPAVHLEVEGENVTFGMPRFCCPYRNGVTYESLGKTFCCESDEIGYGSSANLFLCSSGARELVNPDSTITPIGTNSSIFFEEANGRSCLPEFIITSDDDDDDGGGTIDDEDSVNLPSDGMQCINTEFNCGSGLNLYRAIQSGYFTLAGNNISQRAVANSIQQVYTSAFTNQICINPDKISNNITSFFGGRVFEEDLPEYSSNDFARVCPVGTVAKSSRYTANGMPNPPFGCCPSTHAYVTKEFTTSDGGDFRRLQDPGNSACCLISPAGTPRFWNPSTGRCLDSNKVPIDYPESANNPIIRSDVSNTTNNPLGIPLGPANLSANPENYLYTGENPTNERVCPSTAEFIGGCAIVPANSSQGTQIPNGVTNENGDPISGKIVSANILRDGENGVSAPILQCLSCIGNGGLIGFDDTEKTIAQCVNGTLQIADMVNDNVADTLACLKSGEGSANFAACAQCRERGGVWTALGCNDTTPLGILTGIMRIAYGVMGGVALIQLIIAGIAYQTGQEEQIKKARKQIIQTITGLVVLTFSVLILRIIGINILDIVPEGFFG